MSENDPYTPPAVWTWDDASGGTWASINRPTAGAQTDMVLPRGEHPLQLYSLGTPNGQKVTILLEELLEHGVPGAEYDAFLVRIGDGEQFGSGFVELNPNSKIPALFDVERGVRVFESGAILLYLADRFEAFLPADPAGRTEALNWLFWLQGAAPFVGGGFGHFYKYAPIKIEYAINRYTMETKRLLDVLDQRLAQADYVGGSQYGIADIAIWPWFGALVLNTIYDAGAFLSVREYPHVRRWAEAVAARPAVQRGKRVNRTEGEGAVPERHSAADFGD
ncbi:MAG: glutathione-dependent disulfide-bond oxidoreductase [Pseudomonadota bacterium]